DVAGGGDQKRQLGLGDVPLAVAADADLAVGGDDAVAGGFEEQFRALGGVDPVVEVTTAGRFRFLHAGLAAAPIRNSGGPDLLSRGGGEDLLGLGGRLRVGDAEADVFREVVA